MNKYSYPAHVVEAVAIGLAKQRFIQISYRDLSSHDKEALIRDASDLLQSFWEASRINSLDQLEEMVSTGQIPRDALVQDKWKVWTDTADDAINGEFDEDDFPAQVLYWGASNGE